MTILKVEKREVLGSQVSKLRRDGILPAVIYSKGQESISIQTSINEFVRVYKVLEESKEIILELDGKEIQCIIQDLDVHPVKGIVRHVDFLIVNKK